MATLLKVLINLADIKSAGGVALRVGIQDLLPLGTTNKKLLGLATVDGEFVAIGIAAVTGIGVRPECARANCALVLGAAIESRLVKGCHSRAARCLKADRATI